jgi:glycosyltransferase involved in cell wall biosynthesis
MAEQKILFITRKYPPSTGGMQKVNYELSQELKKITPTKIIAYGGSQKYLFFIYPLLLVRGVFKSLIFKPEKIILGDGLMAPIGCVLKLFTSAKIVCIVHGLDVTYNFQGYQQVIPFCLKQLDQIISVSSATKEECVKRGISRDKVKVIPNGIDVEEYQTDKSKDELKRLIEGEFEIDLDNKKVLLTVGRLVKRKGHEWFIRAVMPELDENIIYLIAGTGEEKENIEKAIKEKKLNGRVFMLGWITEEMKKYLLNYSDVFVMPNIKVQGDAEGFGIVSLEAASVGLPTVASNIEGIKDAVEDGVSGYLVEEKNKEGFIDSIKKVLNSSDLIKHSLAYVENYNWQTIVKNHLSFYSLS